MPALRSHEATAQDTCVQKYCETFWYGNLSKALTGLVSED